jgi:hypothetical protein
VKISIDAQCSRGLRIISETPDLPIAIEGYNGIGKTTSIKLLDLCTGGQPFKDDPASWRTFRQQLISGTVRITALDGANDLELILDPANWPESPTPLEERIGTIRIDGKRATASDISQLLRVVHIKAAETPLAVLGERVDRSRRYLDTWLSDSGSRY